MRQEQQPTINEDVPVNFGTSCPSAYQPSGQLGNIGTVHLNAFYGMLAGLGSAGGCIIVATLLNLIHNMLPVFKIAMPLAILGLMAVAPIVIGIVAGWVVANGIHTARCRNANVAAVIAMIYTWGGMIAVFIAAQLITDGTFLTEYLLPFTRFMVGAAFNFEWLEDPKPVAVPTWIILGIIGLAALGGTACAWQMVDEKIRSTPFCESCSDYAANEILWTIHPVHAAPMADAFRDGDLDAIHEILKRDDLMNRVEVHLFNCNCRKLHMVEMTGIAMKPQKNEQEEPEEREPVRLLSLQLTHEQYNAIQACSRKRDSEKFWFRAA